MRVIPGGGHLNSSAGFVTFDTLFADILAAAGFGFNNQR